MGPQTGKIKNFKGTQRALFHQSTIHFPCPLLGKILGMEALLGSAAAATLLHVHPKTLIRMAREGRVPAIRIGKLWMFRASQLDSWVSSQ
jgi:excisionase family DNA binding protein